MKRFFVIFAMISVFCISGAYAQEPSVTSPMASPAPAILLAQVDDSDLRDEETLQELMQIEYDKDAWSMGAAVGASLVPGAGWGLVYAEKPVQSLVPIVLSLAGYGIGIAYIAGAFDTQRTQICRHVPTTSRVDLEVCDYGNMTRDARNPDAPDNLDDDPRSILDASGQPIPNARPKKYFDTKNDYEKTFIGEDFDGQSTGVWILVGTYALTTVIGAVWAAMTVSAHNEQLRKDIESTAGLRRNSSPVKARPILGVSQGNGVVGFAIDF